MCCPPRIISEFAQVTHAKRLFLKTTSEEPALLMPYWYPRAKQPAKCKSSYPSELHQMTENTQLCMTWVGGRVGHKDEQTISSCFTNRFSARLHSRLRSLKGKLRQQPAKPTSVFHDVPFSHWPISPLQKDNRTNNWPPPQPLTSNTPLLVRCVGVFQKVHTLLYKSLEPPIISVLNVSCRSCVWDHCHAEVRWVPISQRLSATPFVLHLSSCKDTLHSMRWDDGTGLG